MIKSKALQKFERSLSECDSRGETYPDCEALSRIENNERPYVRELMLQHFPLSIGPREISIFGDKSIKMELTSIIGKSENLKTQLIAAASIQMLLRDDKSINVFSRVMDDETTLRKNQSVTFSYLMEFSAEAIQTQKDKLIDLLTNPDWESSLTSIVALLEKAFKFKIPFEFNRAFGNNRPGLRADYLKALRHDVQNAIEASERGEDPSFEGSKWIKEKYGPRTS